MRRWSPATGASSPACPGCATKRGEERSRGRRHFDNVLTRPDHAPMILRTEGLTKTFEVGVRRRRVDAVVDLSLAVDPGEIFGFVGPNGAGKTTTIKMLMGLIYPTRGKAFI